MRNTQTPERENMAENPFSPLSSAHMENKQLHAAEYTAYYLGEIEKHLGEMAAQMKNETANSSRIALALTGLQQILPKLLERS